jgi:hypothetical protein
MSAVVVFSVVSMTYCTYEYIVKILKIDDTNSEINYIKGTQYKILQMY